MVCYKEETSYTIIDNEGDMNKYISEQVIDEAREREFYER